MRRTRPPPPPPAGPATRLRRFDPGTSIADNACCAVIGMRGTGKSVLIKDLMSYKRHLPWGLVFAGTEEGNGWYEQFVPDSLIYDDFYPNVLGSLIKHQKSLKKKSMAQVRAGALARAPTNGVFLIMDDCLYDSKVLKHKAMRYVFMNGRHFDIFSIVAAQWLYDVPPAMRDNIDYVFVMRNVNSQTRFKMWKSFFGVVPTFQEFNAIMDKYTRDHRCIVLCAKPQADTGDPISDHVFWYKASTAHAGLRVCARETWQMHDLQYDPDYESGSEDDDAPAAPKSRKKQGR